MDNRKSFPAQQKNRFYLTEGGTETELMYKYGFELPQFAMFPLLNNPAAVAKMQEMFRNYLDKFRFRKEIGKNWFTNRVVGE